MQHEILAGPQRSTTTYSSAHVSVSPVHVSARVFSLFYIGPREESFDSYLHLLIAHSIVLVPLAFTGPESAAEAANHSHPAGFRPSLFFSSLEAPDPSLDLVRREEEASQQGMELPQVAVQKKVTEEDPACRPHAIRCVPQHQSSIGRCWKFLRPWQCGRAPHTTGARMLIRLVKRSSQQSPPVTPMAETHSAIRSRHSLGRQSVESYRPIKCPRFP
jgi:hypothetical protein